MRYALVILLVLIGLSSAQSPFSGGPVTPGPSVSTPPSGYVITPPVQPQDIYLTSRTEYTRDNQNRPGVVILLSAWQPGTPNDTPVPGVNIYITGGPTYKKVTTGQSGYIFVKWPFDDSDMGRDWSLSFSPDPNDPYAPGSAATNVCAHVPDDLSSFTPLDKILNAYTEGVYQSVYLN